MLIITPTVRRYESNACIVARGLVQEKACETFKQEEIALWPGVEGNGSLHDGDGTTWHWLTMDIAKGLSICERTCYACIAHLDTKASEQEGEAKVHL